MDRLEAMSILLAVVEAGSLSAAARRRGIRNVKRSIMVSSLSSGFDSSYRAFNPRAAA